MTNGPEEARPPMPPGLAEGISDARLSCDFPAPDSLPRTATPVPESGFEAEFSALYDLAPEELVNRFFEAQAAFGQVQPDAESALHILLGNHPPNGLDVEPEAYNWLDYAHERRMLTFQATRLELIARVATDLGHRLVPAPKGGSHDGK